MVFSGVLCWMLARGGKGEQRRKKAWVKMGNSYPFIEATKAVRLPTSLLRIAYFSSATIDGTGDYPYPY